MAVFAIFIPATKPLRVVEEIEIIVCYVSVCESQCHARIVSPLSRFQLERATANHVTDMFTITGQKLERCTHGVANREPQQAALCAVQRLLLSDGARP
ncbi:hypothetical protein D3C80_1652930 [compost metagenome]